MSDVALISHIPPLSEQGLARVRELEAMVLQAPQTTIPTSHVFHAGVYARTITVPAGSVLTGALIKCATVLILNGHAIVYLGDGSAEFRGYHVLPAMAGRKQALIALEDTDMTMIFATDVKTVQEAEDAFTDEVDRLFSRAPGAVNTLVMTGE